MHAIGRTFSTSTLMSHIQQICFGCTHRRVMYLDVVVAFYSADTRVRRPPPSLGNTSAVSKLVAWKVLWHMINVGSE